MEQDTENKKNKKTLFYIICIVLALILLSAALLLGYREGVRKGTETESKKAEKIIQEKEKQNNQLTARIEEMNRKGKEERPWNLTLVNQKNPMEEGYIPELETLYGYYKVDKRILQPLKEMLSAAEAEGLHPKVCSAYRSVEKQEQLYNTYMRNEVKKGKTYWEALEITAQTTAYPGESEHGLGLAVDIISPSYQVLDERQKDTPEAQWLLANCHKYGFILRFPPEKADVTGILYEPWHFRYVGVEDATKIMEMGITLEEYLGETN